MRPVLLDLGILALPAYFTLLALGFGLAMLLTVRAARSLGLTPQFVLDMNIYMIIFGVLGARVLHVVADGHFWDYVNLCVDPARVSAIDALSSTCTSSEECGIGYLCGLRDGVSVCHPPRDCLAWARLWRGGFAYYGGFLFASLFCVYYSRRHRVDERLIGDLAAPGIMLGLFCGRMGCYLNGCCYGKGTDALLGLRFPPGSAPWKAQLDAHLIQAGAPMLPVHPTQLYEGLGCLLIFAFLYYYARVRKHHNGEVYGYMLVLYAALRSLCEVFRDDERGVFFGFLSTSQILSIPAVLIGLWMILFVRWTGGLRFRQTP